MRQGLVVYQKYFHKGNGYIYQSETVIAQYSYNYNLSYLCLGPVQCNEYMIPRFDDYCIFIEWGSRYGH